VNFGTVRSGIDNELTRADIQSTGESFRVIQTPKKIQKYSIRIDDLSSGKTLPYSSDTHPSSTLNTLQSSHKMPQI